MITTAEYMELNSRHYEEIEKLENQIQELKKENWRIEELEDDLQFFIKNFIDFGNNETTLHNAYARLFEIYKGYGYEKYYKESK